MTETTTAPRQFAYVGDRDEITAWGMTFARGQAVEVTDAKALKKLPGNPDFVEFVGGVEVASPRATVEPEPAAKPAKAKRK